MNRTAQPLPQAYVRHLLAGSASAPGAPAALVVDRVGVGLDRLVAAAKLGLAVGFALSTLVIVAHVATAIV